MLKEKPSQWIIVLLLLVLATLIISVVVMRQFMHSKTSTPCLAIPRQFLFDEPACVDKLLMSMNVTNVQVLPQVLPHPTG
jgi:hypothetical protein